MEPTTTVYSLRFTRAYENYGRDYRILTDSQKAAIDAEIQYDLAAALAYYDEAAIK